MYSSRGILILAACLTACAGFKITSDVSKEFDQANVLPLEESDLDLISGKRDADDDPMMGCGMATADRCYGLLPHDGSRPTYLHEEISRIQSAQVCQWFCSDIYAPNCTWFLYDKTTMDCKIFSAPLELLHEDCQELGFSSSTPYWECTKEYDASGEDACLYFRQDYCRFDKDLLDNLEYVDNLTHCQEACQIHNLCNFFTYDQMESICKLHHVDLTNRVCDIIHGPPSPSFQSCLDDDMVPWAGMSDEDTTNMTESSAMAAGNLVAHPKLPKLP